MEFHKRISGNCDCKPPLVCSVLPNKFWCGACGRDLEPLTKKQLRFIHKCKNRDEVIIGCFAGA